MKKKSLLAKYSIGFKKKNITSPISGRERIVKIFDTSNNDYHILSELFYDFQKPEDVQIGILEIVEQVECNNIKEGETGSQSGVAVYINPENTKLVGFNSPGTYLDPDLILPTVDFKLIAMAWKYFLEK